MMQPTCMTDLEAWNGAGQLLPLHQGQFSHRIEQEGKLRIVVRNDMLLRFNPYPHTLVDVPPARV